MTPIFQSMEQRICALLRRQAPRRIISRLAFWLFIATVLMFLLRLVPGFASRIGSLPWLTLIAAVIASLPALFRWMRWHLLWKLRNRLFVTYLLIGVTPVVLFGVLSASAAYVLFGQFANFAATSEITRQLTELAANNQALALHFQHDLVSQGSTEHVPQLAVPPEARAVLAMPELRVAVYVDGRLQPLDLPPSHTLTDVPTPPAWVPDTFSGLILTGDRNYFRAVNREQAGAHTVTVISSMPLDSDFLARLASGLGRVTLWPLIHLHSKTQESKSLPHKGASIQIGTTDQAPATIRYSRTKDSQGEVSGGVLPKAQGILDIPINFPATLATHHWTTGHDTTVFAVVTSRPSLLYHRLFHGSQLIGGSIRIALISAGIVFFLLELLAIFFAAWLSRTITHSVSDLYHATREVDRGRLNYRIPVSRQDQLAALSRSFNTMSASLERLLEEQKEKDRLQSELEIAHEVQSNLFPSHGIRLGNLELHGLCRPARTVSGDYYDFLVLGDHALCLAIGDISGKGISAALLMAGLHSAVRAYRFAGEAMFTELTPGALRAGQGEVPSDGIFQAPANLMRLLNHHLYRSTQQEKYATLFLTHYDAKTSVLRYSNGGHLPPLVLRVDGSILRLDRGGTVVGLLDNMEYEEGAVTLEPGDLLIAYSDGVTEPENEFGDFGEERLVELVRSNRHLPLEEISSRVVQALEDWIGAEEQPDDITLVLARQHARHSAP
ncbi:MAG: SpoIIE family protein phosphatase [Acidobacteriaceae bacterium]